MAIESLGEIDTQVGTLRCTLRAFESINTHFGSFGDALARISRMDAGAMAVIAAYGQGKKVDEVKKDVFTIGPQNLTESFGKYLSMLSNGGKLPADASDEDARKGEA